MKYLLLLLIALSTNVLAKEIITQLSMNNQASEVYKDKERELTRIYNNLLQTHKDNIVFVRNLIDSQKKWHDYLESQIALIYKSSSDIKGSVYSMCVSSGYQYLMRLRIEELKHLDEHEEGNVCEFHY